MESTNGKPADGPHRLGDLLSQVFAVRGYGQVQARQQLQAIWAGIAGESIAAATRVQGVRNGVLVVGVSSSALLQELESFHRSSLTARLKQDHADLGIRELRFQLSSRPPVSGPTGDASR